MGTSGCKGVTFDEQGNMLAQSYRENKIISPRTGWAELEPDTLWENVTQIIKENSSETKSDPIQAISISVQGEAFLPADKDMKPLHNAIISFDNRALEECNWWKENVGKERIFEITGMPLHSIYSINKIMWLKKHRPKIYKKSWRFLCLEDFIHARLGLKPHIGYSLASRTMAFDICQKRWSEEILTYAGIDKDLFSEPADLSKVVGEISETSRKKMGLKKGVVVVAGGHDAICSLVGAGVIEPGMTMVVSGTSEGIVSVSDNRVNGKKLMDSNYAYYCFTADKKAAAGYNPTGGLLIKWFRDNFEGTKEYNYERIIENAVTAPAKLFILPHFVGSGTPYLDNNSRGAIVGLTLSTTKKELIRAMLDSLSYEMLINIESLGSAGMKISGIHVIGGGARSKKWLQIKADVWGREVYALKNIEAACLGCAVIAGVGTGRFMSLNDGVKQMVQTDRVYSPNSKRHREYARLFEIYRQVYPRLKNIYGGKYGVG